MGGGGGGGLFVGLFSILNVSAIQRSSHNLGNGLSPLHHC